MKGQKQNKVREQMQDQSENRAQNAQNSESARGQNKSAKNCK